MGKMPNGICSGSPVDGSMYGTPVFGSIQPANSCNSGPKGAKGSLMLAGMTDVPNAPVRESVREKVRRCGGCARGATPASRVGPDALLRAVSHIVTAHVAILRFRVDDRPIRGILPRVEAVAAAHREPVGIDRSRGGAHGARSAPRIIVLQAAADVIGAAHVGRYLIELADGNIVVIIPGQAAIVRDIEAAIVAHHDGARIFGVDPESVVIGVRTVDRGPGLAAVD